MSLHTSRLVEAARTLHDRVRRSVAIALRDRVGGRDNAAKAAVIWDKPGERWFTQPDPIWRVRADASMFAAGVRALRLQSLHPLAMAGVAGHSGYKGDPGAGYGAPAPSWRPRRSAPSRLPSP